MRLRLANVADVREFRGLGDDGAPVEQDASVVIAPSLVGKTIFAGVATMVVAHFAIRFIEGFTGWGRR